MLSNLQPASEHLPLIQIAVMTPPKILLAPQSETTVKNFRSYRMRLPLTASCLIVGLVLTLLSPPRLKNDGELARALDLVGTLLIVGGISIRLWATSCIIGAKTVKIICDGPYAWCRNPLYIGTFVIILGFLCLVKSLTLVICILPVVALYLFGVVPAEECVMRFHHGEAFVVYCQTVPRWIPRPSFLLAQLRQIWQSKGLRGEVECSIWWIAFAVIVWVVCDWRTATWWDHPMYWP